MCIVYIHTASIMGMTSKSQPFPGKSTSIQPLSPLATPSPVYPSSQALHVVEAIDDALAMAKDKPPPSMFALDWDDEVSGFCLE